MAKVIEPSPQTEQAPAMIAPPPPPKRGRGVLVWAVILGLISGILGAVIVVWIALPIIKNVAPGIITQKQELVTVKEDSAIIDAVKKIQPVVVSIVSTKNVMDFFGEVTQEEGGGTGFIISADGLILTNKHVISDSTAQYSVLLYDGRSFPGQIVSTDPLNDLGVIRISASGLPVAELGDSDSLQIGQRAIAIGNALGEFQNTVTSGIISAVHRTITAGTGADAERLEDLIQTDAAINPGNSGGPLLNIDGQVIGINSAIAESAQNIGFALPINQAKFAINSVKEHGIIIRPYLGVRYVTVTKQLAQLEKLSVDHGAYLVSGSDGGSAIATNSPADKAGLKEGDIIIKLGTQILDNEHPLASVLINFEPNSPVEITIVRNGVENKVTVTLGQLKS